nr:olfactory receptor 1509-like [Chrysemys picta bellii]
MQDVSVVPSFNIGSDHHLLRARLVFIVKVEKKVLYMANRRHQPVAFDEAILKERFLRKIGISWTTVTMILIFVFLTTYFTQTSDTHLGGNLPLLKIHCFTPLLLSDRLMPTHCYITQKSDIHFGEKISHLKIQPPNSLDFDLHQHEGFLKSNDPLRPGNTGAVHEIVLLGLSQPRVLSLALAILLLLSYAIVLLGNLSIILTIRAEPRLAASPMYYLLGNLSLVDLCYTSVTTPQMALGLLSGHATISLGECLAQLFFLHFLGCTEIFLLTAMAYDRYVAICQPLHYTAIMSCRTCARLVAGSWMGALAHSLVQTLLATTLPYCGPNHIDHYFCDVAPLLGVACTDTSLVEILVVSNTGAISLGCFLVLLVSYGVILAALRRRSTEGRLKALSTCTAHLMVVAIFFGPCIFIYTRPFSTIPADKVVSLLATVVTPMLNPLIYTLRNTEMKGAMRRLWGRWVRAEK